MFKEFKFLKILLFRTVRNKAKDIYKNHKKVSRFLAHLFF